MPEELGCIINKLENVKLKKYGDFEIFSGIWTNASQKKINLSVAWSGWGKVSSARATTRLISTLQESQKISNDRVRRNRLRQKALLSSVNHPNEHLYDSWR